MAVGGYIRIYRKTAASDTFASLGTTEKIELNVNGTDNTIANMWSTRWFKGATRANAEHGNPNEELSEQQDTGKDEEAYTIEFVISRSDLVGNQFLINLELWNDEVGGQESLALPFGRFSIDFDDNPHFIELSDATKGLIIKSIDYEKNEEIQNALMGTIVLTKGKNVS